MSQPPASLPHNVGPQDILLCYCFRIPERDVIRLIKEKKPGTLRELLALTQAGHGCGCCQPDLETLLGQFRRGEQMKIKLPGGPSLMGTKFGND